MPDIKTDQALTSDGHMAISGGQGRQLLAYFGPCDLILDIFSSEFTIILMFNVFFHINKNKHIKQMKNNLLHINVS